MPHPLKQHARRLRKQMTDAERRIWGVVRRKQIHGVPFYRQRPVGNYILDFYAPRIRLAIEVDGSQHFSSVGRKRDEEREWFLRSKGIDTIRFDNRQVLRETEGVADAIRREVAWRMG